MQWEKRLDDAITSIKATVTDYTSVTVGWFLGDELIQSGIPVANLTAVARRIKQQYALPTMVYTNEGKCNKLIATCCTVQYRLRMYCKCCCNILATHIGGY